MTEHHSVVEYFSGPEELTRKELVWGIVREPAAPTCSHQAVVGRTFLVLASYAGRRGLGRVLVSPVDVVLDEAKALVLQPDIVFVAAERAGIVRDRIWGAPDLVVEVVSPGTKRRDTVDKRRWYRRYGVREYWIIDPVSQTVEVSTLDETTGRVQRTITHGRGRVCSNILRGLAEPTRTFFE